MQYKFETKNTRPSKFKQEQKCSPICQNTFQGDINFCSARKVKILSEKLGKSYRPSKNSKHSAGLIYKFLETPYQSKKTNTSKIKPKSGKTGDTGGERNAGEGCHNEAFFF